MYFKTYLTCVGLLLGLGWTTASADLIEESVTVNTAIPDNDAGGLASSLTVSTEMDTIQSLEVTLHISGVSAESPAFGGDLYCSLQNEAGGFAVLLNRVGKTSSDDWGSDMNGFDVTFTLDGSDIHLAETASPSYDADGRLTGTWGVDGRTDDPDNVTEGTENRTALLSSFNHSNPNGTWTLFVADTELNGTAKLDSWGVKVQAIPEPAVVVLIGLAGVGGLLVRRFFM